MTDFTSQSNKGLLWNLMVDNNVFAGVPDTEFSHVKRMFENEVLNHSKSDGTILEKNKKVLVKMNNNLNSLREQMGEKEDMNNSRLENTLVTADELSEARKTAMDNKLNKKQQEFSQLIHGEKPKDIDFTDSPDEKPIGSEMDSLLENMMAKRKRELNQVIAGQDQNAAEKWISNEGKGVSVEQGPPSLQIGEKLDTPNITIVNNNTSKPVLEKHVTFSADANETEPDANNAKSLDLFQFLSVNKSNTDAPFMSPEDKTDNKKPDIVEARAAVTAEAKHLAKEEIMQKLSRIEYELMEIKDILKNA